MQIKTIGILISTSETLPSTTYGGIGVIVVLVLVLLLVLAILSNFVLDTRLHRERVARRLNRLATRLFETHVGLSEAQEYSRRADVAAQMARAVKSNYRFERCYALETLKKAPIGSRDERWAWQLRGICAESLRSEDPFVRHSAANLFASMGPNASFAVQQLIDTLSEYPNESAGRYAAEALGQIPPTQIRELDQRRLQVLIEAIRWNSVAAESARTAYHYFTGEAPPEEAPGGILGTVC